MEIIIAQRLRDLRRRRGNTQEDLAHHLGVSTQAVSKWERNEGWPDLSFLPAIASYYAVTVDHLLGVDAEERRRRVEQISDKYNQIRGSKNAYGLPDVGFRIEEGIAFLRDAVRELPDEAFLGQLLASDLWWYAQNRADGTERPALLLEAEEVCRRILSDCKEERWRNCARQLLCLILNAQGAKDDARRIAADMPDATGTDLFMLTFLLEGEELKDHLRFAIRRFLQTLYRCSERLKDVGGEYKLNVEEQAQFDALTKTLATQT